MGKAKKLKELRRLKRQENFLNKKEKKKKFLITSAIIIVISLAGFSIYSLKDNMGSNSENNSEIAEIQEEEIQEENQEQAQEEIQEKTEELQNSSEEKIAVLETNFGTIKFKLFYEDAPKTCANFEKLAGEKFYDGIKFHRVMKDFMIQTGDPKSRDDDWSDDGTGGPGYKFEDEINEHKLVKGIVAMANSGPNTNGSQFFIVTTNATPWLDGKHTAFGEVIEGMDIVEKIENSETNQKDHPLEDIVMEKVYIEEF